MKKFVSFLSSMLLTGILIVIFGISIAYATFIENDYGAITAKIAIYNSRWMEFLFLLLTLNLVGSMFKYKLISKKKWSILLFHIAFIVILIGAGLTRYFGSEGTLVLTEGETKSEIISDATFLQLKATNSSSSLDFEKEVMFSPNAYNKYSKSIEIDGHSVKVKLIDFYTNVTETIVEDINGTPALRLIAAGANTGRVDFVLFEGIQKDLDEITYSYGDVNGKSGVSFSIVGNDIKVIANDTIIEMGSGETPGMKLIPNSSHVIYSNIVYQIGFQKFMIEKAVEKGRVVLKNENETQSVPLTDIVHLSLAIDDYHKELFIPGKKGYVGTPVIFEKNGIRVEMAYGSKIISLPFSIHLRDFQLDRYPGSNSPSSYASEVTLIDPSNNIEMPFRIYMNNILKYRGFRFFQSSYTTDEKGTILSVNSDLAGTSVTYIGYFLMIMGMLLTLFNGNSYFKLTLKKLANLKLNGNTTKNFLLILFFSGYCNLANAQENYPDWKPLDIEKEQIYEFSELLIQDHQGRIKPISSLASELLRKLSRQNSFENMSASHVILDMLSNNNKWYSVPILKVSHSDLQKTLRLNDNFASYNDLVKTREQGGYVLQQMVNETYHKKPIDRNKLDKEIMNVDERINVLMQIFHGDYLKVFPVPGDSNHLWVSAQEASKYVTGEDAVFINEIFPKYFSAIIDAQQTGNYTAANIYLSQIKSFQQKYGNKIIPSENKVKIEVFYNKWNIFGKLAKYYILAGMILLIIRFIKIFNTNTSLNIPIKIISGIIFFLFLFHTTGLGIRWYIAGHAPWSNGYESMIYVGWATMLSGLIFMKKSPITLAATTILAALVLFVAGMSWMNPEITSLVPVLKSYWLIVHVAVITASYGFFALAALLGFLNLNLMIFINGKNKKSLIASIKEMSFIIEVTLIIGLILMTTGSFLGAVWANESWGRYWGWDPKETWSLVTILVYTFALHMRKIEGFRGQFALSVAALISISSVLMTYFGVNYYLSGLHSYGQGNPPPIPNGIYIAIVIIVAVIVGATISNKKTNFIKHI